jgi:hypothetical protein
MPPAGVKQKTMTPLPKPAGMTVKRVMGKVTLDKSLSGKSKSVAVYDLGGHLLKQKQVNGETIDLRKDFGIAVQGIYIMRVKTQ